MLLVACLEGFVIQVCVPYTIHVPSSFQGKEIEMNGKKKEEAKDKKRKIEMKKKEKKNRKVVHKVFGLGV